MRKKAAAVGPKSFCVAREGRGCAVELPAMVTFILLLLMVSFRRTGTRDWWSVESRSADYFDCLPMGVNYRQKGKADWDFLFYAGWCVNLSGTGSRDINSGSAIVAKNRIFSVIFRS
jgi:hypothetical protein